MMILSLMKMNRDGRDVGAGDWVNVMSVMIAMNVMRVMQKLCIRVAVSFVLK